MDFQKIFKALTGCSPLRWQQRLYNQMCSGKLPDVCDLPTGLGKTSVITIWLIAFAKQIADGKANLLPRRLIYIVNRRTVVDQATAIVEELRRRVEQASQPELEWLKKNLDKARANRNQNEPVLAVSTLRGELADNGEWKSDPARPAIIIGTIDMIGSKLLFAGYGDSYKLRPHHAGLIGQDALIVHDEAHLTPAFSDLLQTIVKEQHRSEEARPVIFLELSATVSNGANRSIFGLECEDYNDEIVSERLNAKKSLRLHKTKSALLPKRIARLACDHDKKACKVLIYVNSLEAAQEVVRLLKKQLGRKAKERIALLTGTIRGDERDRMVRENPVYQAFLNSGSHVEHTVYLVSTPAGEVGIDLDADHLVCDLTTLDAMIQRLGRVNRRGGKDRQAQVDVVVTSSDALKAMHDAGEGRQAQVDVVVTADAYTGKKKNNRKAELSPLDYARLNTLNAIKSLPKKEDGCYDVSPKALRQLLVNFPNAVAPKPETVPLTDILLDGWTLTTLKGKLPGQPEVVTYLHGLEANQPETYVTWRAEVSLLEKANISSEQLRDWFSHCRIEAREQLRDATYRVHKELQKIAERHNGADIPVVVLSERGEPEMCNLRDVLQKGVPALAYRTIILPVEVGGLTDEGLLDGNIKKQALDVAEAGGKRERLLLEGGNGRYLVRALTSSEVNLMIDQPSPQKAAEKVAQQRCRSMSQLVPLRLPSEWEEEDETEQKFLLLLVEPKRAAEETPESANTEKQPTVDEHCKLAEQWAARFGEALNLESGQKEALEIAARWHDRGKARKVWQRAIFNEDKEDKAYYAKPGPQGIDSRRLNGYRHEFGSLLEAMADSEISSHPEADLILHLIAVHHGWARPHFLPSAWDLESHTEAQNRQAALEAMRRFGRLQQCFGRWGLAWLESLMRCVDILASRQIRPTED